MKRFLFIFIISFLYLQNLTGKEVQYSYAQLSINEGLSQANVETILLDQRGELWIGTRNGLNHYTQQKINHFFHQMGNKNSLPNSRVIHLEEDSLGNIWVATINGLTLYDREYKNFRTLTRGQVKSSLCIDGGVLFGGENVLYFYNYQTQDLERIPLHPEASDVIPIEYRVEKILPFKDNQLLLGTRKKGLFTYDCSTREVKPFTGDIPNLMLFSFCLASDGSIYVAYYGNGVYRFNQQGEKIEFYMTGNSPISNNYVMDILEHDGKLWIATDGGGINQIDLKTRKFSVLHHTTGDKMSLPVNSITKLYKDYNGTLWAGSVRGGVFTIKESYIKTYQDVVMGNSSGLTEKSIISIHEEKNGTLWIGTDGGGINRYNPTTNQFTHYPDTYGDKVVSIANLSEDELLLSLYTKGIFTFNKKTGQQKPFIVVDQETNQRECFYGYLPLLSNVNENKIYIISYGAWVYHIPTKQFTPLLLPEEYRNSTSALKLAFTHTDFSLLQQKNRAFIVNQQDENIQLLFEANVNENIYTMTYDADNRTIWIGTNHGLSYYHMDKKEYKHFPTNLFNSVTYLTLDSEKRLWICADNKLFTYYINEDKFNSWSKSDGYLPNEIKAEYQTTFNKDYIYLCGSQGLVRIKSSIHPVQEEHPEIYLADIMYNGESSIKQMKNDEFEVPWDYHSFVLTLGLKSKDVFQKYLIKYIIKDASGENTYESYETQLNLSSLSPGTYTLLASCYTKDGNEITPVQLLSLTVTPPWYKNTWFICLMILLFIGGTLGIGRWIYRKKTRQMKGDVGEFLQTVLHSLNKKDEQTEETETSEVSQSEDTESEIKEPVLNEADKMFLEKMNKLIHDNLSNEELSAKFLTDHLAMSRASLYNKVKILTGMGVNDYINRIRIERSVHLLTHTDMSINDISYEVGFSYPRYFSTSFKQVKGMTPTRFKEESKKNMTK